MLAAALASGGLAALLAMRYLQQKATPLAAQPIRSQKISMFVDSRRRRGASLGHAHLSSWRMVKNVPPRQRG